jgi:hypothetical protein
VPVVKLKKTVKFSRCLNKYHAMEIYEGVEIEKELDISQKQLNK